MNSQKTRFARKELRSLPANHQGQIAALRLTATKKSPTVAF
ncbi:MAG: hypothetical protein SXA11_12600 [Cyanobacteriota bacterium]|nr:hypothetical protein [Cyanobacteriota bacterium]